MKRLSNKITKSYLMDPYAMMMHYKRAFKLLSAMQKERAKVLILGNKNQFGISWKGRFEGVEFDTGVVDEKLISGAPKHYEMILCLDPVLYCRSLRRINLPVMMCATAREISEHPEILDVTDYLLPSPTRRHDAALRALMGAEILGEGSSPADPGASGSSSSSSSSSRRLEGGGTARGETSQASPGGATGASATSSATSAGGASEEKTGETSQASPGGTTGASATSSATSAGGASEEKTGETSQASPAGTTDANATSTAASAGGASEEKTGHTSQASPADTTAANAESTAGSADKRAAEE